MKRWVEHAREQGRLRITEDKNCPYHNPMHQKDIPIQPNACEKHLWVSKKWFNRFEAAYLNVTKE